MAFRAQDRNSIALALALVAACSSAPPAPQWQGNAAGSLRDFQQRYLVGDTKGADDAFASARSELTATGRADLVARAELIRCAAQVASLVFDRCAGFEALRADAGSEERSYADYLDGHVIRPASSEPFSRLVAYGVQVRAATISPQGIAAAVEIASMEGWRRPLLAWLGMELQRAEAAGDSETAARLKRRIELVSG
jgi:hypothetical protein